VQPPGAAAPSQYLVSNKNFRECFCHDGKFLTFKTRIPDGSGQYLVNIITGRKLSFRNPEYPKFFSYHKCHYIRIDWRFGSVQPR